VDANDLMNVILINAALSDHLGNLRIKTKQSDGVHAGGGSTISERGVICAALSIDALNVNDLVMLQLDVEGHEVVALKGAMRTIEKCRPVVAMEDNNNNCSDLLKSLRYDILGSIPGLVIWVPTENRAYKSQINAFLGAK
jgi:hypothetical protein